MVRLEAIFDNESPLVLKTADAESLLNYILSFISSRDRVGWYFFHLVGLCVLLAWASLNGRSGLRKKKGFKRGQKSQQPLGPPTLHSGDTFYLQITHTAVDKIILHYTAFIVQKEQQKPDVDFDNKGNSSCSVSTNMCVVLLPCCFLCGSGDYACKDDEGYFNAGDS